MIPILYPKTETAFTSNGIGKLAEATRCEVTEERNGEFELVLEYPVGGKYAADITEGAYILAKHDDGTDLQPFQIYKISTPLEGTITVNAWHISYALTSIILKPYTAGSLAAALSGITTNSMNTNPFTFWTDKTMTADFTLDVPASVRSVLGGMAGSILDIYGPGEYEFDKYTVKFYANRGSNKGVSIRYRKNLTSLDQEIDASEKFNAVMPYWTGSDSKVVSDALVVRTGETADRAIALDLSGEFDEAPTVAQLKARAQTIIDGSANYRVRENIKIDFVPLWQTEEYKTVAALQRVMLCDTVNIFYEKLGINATAKCIKVVYDTLRERYNSIELGEPRTTLGDQIRGEITQEITEKVPTKGFIETAIEKATELIAGGFGGYIKFNYLPDGTPSEMLIMDSADESTAVNIIRLNQNGLGFSTDGGATYANAWTIDGNLNADFITAGILNAARIQAGLLQDASGKNYWNLDTGQFVTQQGQIADFIIDQTSLRSGTVGQGTDGTAITDGAWESTKTGTIIGSGYTYQYTVKTKISNGGIEMYASRDDIDADLVQVLKIEPHVWYVNGTVRHNVYFLTSDADGYLFSINKATEVAATAYPFNVHKRTEFLEGVKFDKDVQIGTDLTNANLDVHGQIESNYGGNAISPAVSVSHGTTNKESTVGVRRTDTSRGIALMVGAGGINRGLYINDGNMNAWLIYYDDTNIIFGKPVSPTNLPVASTSQAGLVTTGAQTFAGAKTFSKTVTVSDTTANGVGLSLRFADKNDDAYAAIWAAFFNYGGRLYFREMSGGASGVTAYGEVYRLPNPDANRTASANYDILTTKEAVTIAQGGTGATDAATARSNLGFAKSVRLATTVTTSGNTITNSYGQYSAYIIWGIPGTTSRTSIVIPKGAITTSYSQWEISNSGGSIAFEIKYEGTSLLVKTLTTGKTVTVDAIY